MRRRQVFPVLACLLLVLTACATVRHGPTAISLHDRNDGDAAGVMSVRKSTSARARGDAGTSAKQTASPSNVSIRARETLLKAQSFEQAGDAKQALDNYAEAYRRGAEALARHPAQIKSNRMLQSVTIEAGAFYGWHLLDIGRVADGTQVLRDLRKIITAHSVDSSSGPSLIAHARYENFEARYFSDQRDPEASKRHATRAAELAMQATTSRAASIDALALMTVLVRNLNERAQDVSTKVCTLADRMEEMDAKDRRTIRARIACLRYLAADASAKVDLLGAREHLTTAMRVVDNALSQNANDQVFLVNKTHVSLEMADTFVAQQDTTMRERYLREASNAFVNALQGRAFLQRSKDEVRRLYGRIKSMTFVSPEDELTIYTGLHGAVAASATMFPQSRSFGFVRVDSALRISQLLWRDSSQAPEIERILTVATEAVEKSEVLSDFPTFSEDFAIYCSTYSRRATLYAATRDVEQTLADVLRLTNRCGPILDAYPFDFFLRQHFISVETRTGTLLSEALRFKEAIPHFLYASHWGMRDASVRLAEFYREGLGVPMDEQVAKEFDARARRQGFARFTVMADFDGVKAPFPFYVMDWPEDYPFRGIDDQVKWLIVARGGAVDATVTELFHSLQEAARDAHESFADHCLRSSALAALTTR